MKFNKVFDAVTGLPGDVADKLEDGVFVVQKIPRMIAEFKTAAEALHEAAEAWDRIVGILEEKREDQS